MTSELLTKAGGIQTRRARAGSTQRGAVVGVDGAAALQTGSAWAGARWAESRAESGKGAVACPERPAWLARDEDDDDDDDGFDDDSFFDDDDDESETDDAFFDDEDDDLDSDDDDDDEDL